MLDTNVCIRVLRDKTPALRQRFSEEAGGLCISAITLTELLHGAERSARPPHNRALVENFASRLDVLAFDAEAAAHAGEIRAYLERAGQMIGPYDLLIAAHGRCHGLVVVTSNLGEFNRVPGLRVENWF